MTNARMVYNNIADTATITAATTAAGFNVASLKSNKKSAFHRSTGFTQTYTLNWATSQRVGLVAIPFCSLSSVATMRVIYYSDVGITTIYDSGVISVIPAKPANYITAPAGGNGFAYGGGDYAVNWSTLFTTVRQVRIILTDTAVIDCSRVVVGEFYEFFYNPDSEASVIQKDETINKRVASGDLESKIGTQSKELSFSFSNMKNNEANFVYDVLRSVGNAYPIFMSFFPIDADKRYELSHTIYGKKSTDTEIRLKEFGINATSITLQEI